MVIWCGDDTSSGGYGALFYYMDGQYLFVHQTHAFISCGDTWCVICFLMIVIKVLWFDLLVCDAFFVS